ncbi:MAG: hypothetical protein KJ058_06395 [Thermoanaerobaculia bacterium]|nr:hypothetical protein [Thermoanaerobaculia bacterium]
MTKRDPENEPGGPGRTGGATALARWYAATAIAVLNGLLLLALLNLAAWWALPRARSSPIQRYGIEKMLRAHPDRSEAEVRQIVEESFGEGMRLEFHPAALFRSPETSGRFVNVHAAGFRQGSEPLPWPPAPDVIVVFVFGGSTAFGLGVADGETIASALQTILGESLTGRSVSVYNFGVPAFFSSQELALFSDLLRRGHVPDAAVFVDGLNEFALAGGDPEFSTRFRHMMSAKSRFDWAYAMPLAQWMLRQRVERAEWESGTGSGWGRDGAEAVLSRWRANRMMIEAIADRAGVATLFVWQPVPGFAYDLKCHLFLEGDQGRLGEHIRSPLGYEVAEEWVRRGALGEVLWLGRLQEGRCENFYVDAVHYTPGFSREIAERIAAALVPVLPGPVGPAGLVSQNLAAP